MKNEVQNNERNERDKRLNGRISRTPCTSLVKRKNKIQKRKPKGPKKHKKLESVVEERKYLYIKRSL